MRKTLTAIIAVLIGFGACVGVAEAKQQKSEPVAHAAWAGGASVEPLSCPEIHFKVRPEDGPWAIQARLGAVTGRTAAQRYASFLALPFVTDAAGTPVLNAQVAGSEFDQVIGGFYLPTALPTIVTVAVGNASNLADGFTYRTSTMTNCAAPPVPAPVTVTIDRTVTIIQQVPAPPVPPAAQICKSDRTIKFLVRKRYPGVTNSEGELVKGLALDKRGPRGEHGLWTGLDSDGKRIWTSYRRIKSGVKAGRLEVTIHAAGHRFNAYSNDLRTTVWLKTASGKKFRTLYVSATCRSQQGNPNDQRARTVIIPG